MAGSWNPTSGYNRSSPIPGVTGRRVPGDARLPQIAGNGGFQTRVPFMQSAGGQAGSAIFREHHRQQLRDVNGKFAGGWGFAWVGLEAAGEFIEAWEVKIKADIKSTIEEIKDEMVAYMKENAPWQDHPGVNEDARKNLQGAVVWDDDENFAIFLGHGANVYYGIWLEVRWGGKFAIIVPTIEQFKPIIGDRLRSLT